MKQILTLDRKFTTMNELIEANRRHWSYGAKIKTDETTWVYYQCRAQKLTPFTTPVRIKCVWNYKNVLSDADNLRTQIKPILDGLVMAKILPDDNLKWVTGFDGDEFVKSRKEGAEIHIYEIEE